MSHIIAFADYRHFVQMQHEIPLMYKINSAMEMQTTSLPTLPEPAPVPAPAVRQAHPQVTLVLPFEPKMTPRAILEQKLKDWQSEVEKDLMIGYSSQEVLPVINKLRQLCRNLNFSTHKRSLALFVSPDTAQ